VERSEASADFADAVADDLVLTPLPFLPNGAPSHPKLSVNFMKVTSHRKAEPNDMPGAAMRRLKSSLTV